MNADQQALEHWLEERAESWQWLEDQCKGQSSSARDGDPDIAFVEGFRALGRDLALARTTMPDSGLVQHLASLTLRCREEIYRPSGTVWWTIKDTLLVEVPRIIQSMRGVIAATIVLFVLSVYSGWWLVTSFPELISLIASQDMIDTVEAGGLWTDNLLNIMPSSVLAFSIITNNVVVTLMAFVLGAFYGLGTFYIIAMNGVMLGGVFAFTRLHGLDAGLFEFIIAHGVVELSVICLAGAAGVFLGEALIRPGERSRADAFRYAVSRAASLLLVTVPFLAGAGIIEGYISPDDRIGFGVKLAIGLCYGLLFWYVLAGGFWSKKHRNASSAL